jgi:hypothetical protein
MTMSWELRRSVIANADRQMVWDFVSNIDNLARSLAHRDCGPSAFLLASAA